MPGGFCYKYKKNSYHHQRLIRPFVPTLGKEPGYDGKSIFTYVNGQNLDKFREDIQRYKVLVTYNGRCFKVPFIESYLGIELDQVHIDLRYILRSLGYTGGFKGCEKKAGIDRGDLEGVDGYFAVLFWDDYLRNKSQKAPETLLAYNIQDVVNLETLMVLTYNLKLRDTPFVESHQLTAPSSPEIQLKSKYGNLVLEK